MIAFDEALVASSHVVTGAGRLDAQAAEGKLVAVVAHRCEAVGVECVAVVGQNDLRETAARRLGLVDVIEAGSPKTLEEAGRQVGIRALLVGSTG